MLRAVRLAVQLPTDRVELGAEFVGGAAVAELARGAEAAGFDAVSVTDHPFPPARFVASGGHHSLDPFVALSFAAAATRRVQLLTHVLVLPYRNPFLVAKAAASLDALCEGRLLLGVAAGYLEGEFAALGADFAGRNDATDEALLALRAAWRGEPVAFSGRGFRADGNVQLPRPVRDGGPPLWVGGNSRRAIRRAVERAEGWLPFPAPARMAGFVRTAALETLDDLRARVEYAREHAARIGRTAPLDVCLVPFGFAMGARGEDAARLADALPAYEAAGVTWLALSVAADSRGAWLERAARLAEALAGSTPKAPRKKPQNGGSGPGARSA
jgi:probable F420-dependent oxidoreductase